MTLKTSVSVAASQTPPVFRSDKGRVPDPDGPPLGPGPSDPGPPSSRPERLSCATPPAASEVWAPAGAGTGRRPHLGVDRVHPTPPGTHRRKDVGWLGVRLSQGPSDLTVEEYLTGTTETRETDF